MQDYLEREDAEQFFGDWDEERSSSSSLPSPPSLSLVALPPATAFAINRGSDGADAPRFLREPAPIAPPPPKVVADSLNKIQRSNSAAQSTPKTYVRDSARSGRWDGEPTRKGRVPPSAPAGDAVRAGAESVVLRVRLLGTPLRRRG